EHNANPLCFANFKVSNKFLLLHIGIFAIDPADALIAISFIGELSLFGIIILFWGDLVDDPGNFRGNFFAFISGILAGLYILGGRKHRKKISLPTYAFIVYFSSAITMWVVVLAQGLDYKSISKSEFQLFFVMALVPTLLGHTMQNWALAFLPAYVISITLLAEPVGSGILAWHLFDEVPSLGVLVGGLIVLFGVCLVALSEQDITLEDQS
ncbi:MAG TPA: DMT family transporter, partial [Candidatus Poseidoniia archaeon]|nr:DMT family transporter [Candidatus Poseidoniia archaeon]